MIIIGIRIPEDICIYTVVMFPLPLNDVFYVKFESRIFSEFQYRMLIKSKPNVFVIASVILGLFW